MKFRKKKEKDGESTMWKYAKYAVVAVCVIGIGASSISVIPTGYTGVKSTFGKISEKIKLLKRFFASSYHFLF